MSRGAWNYKNEWLCDEMFGTYPTYPNTKEYAGKLKYVRKSDLFRDHKVTEMVFDMFCLIYSLDSKLSGDSSSYTEEDLEWFKKKWCKSMSKEAMEQFIEEHIERAKQECLAYCSDEVFIEEEDF